MSRCFSAVWLRAALAQVGALLLTAGLAWAGANLDVAWPPIVSVAAQATLAGMLSWVLRLPIWWLPLQVGFVPLVLTTLTLNLPPVVFLTCFALLWLIFRSNTRERVPLYLSNHMTWQAVADLLPNRAGLRVIDLGSGLGGTLAFLAGIRPDTRFRGIESAPLPFLFSWMRLRGRANAEVRMGDFWQEDLSAYDVVYVFLSPAAMQALWHKARAEMRPGTLLISNSFEIPGVTPGEVRTLLDGRRTRLLVWRMPGQ